MTQRITGAGVAKLDENVPFMALRQRIARARHVPQYQLETAAGDAFKCGDAVPAMAPQQGEEFDRLAGGRHRDPGGDVGARAGEELEHGRGNDAQRALGAYEKLLQVITGIVLAQAAQTVPDAPVRQHHFEPQHEVARVAIAQHVGAAGVGGEISPDLAAALGAEAQRKQALSFGCSLLYRRQDAARLRSDGVIERIDFQYAVKASER